MSEYKLVVRFAPYGTGYLKTDGSISKSIGHVWYEVYKDNEKKPMVSAGWAAGDNINPFSKDSCGLDNFKNDDWKRYIGKNIASITVDISEAQAMKLDKNDFPAKAINGQLHNFGRCYGLATNSCIDFAGQALAYIGLADEKDFDGRAASPINQVGVFLGQIAKNRSMGADLKLEYYGQSIEFKSNERTEKEIGKVLQKHGLYFDLTAANKTQTNLVETSVSPAQDMVNQLFAAYTSGNKDALSSVVPNHAYTQQRNQEVGEQVQQLKEAEQQRMVEQLAEAQQVEQRHRMVRS